MTEQMDLYKDWAFEILQLIDRQHQLTDYTEETIDKLANKLKTDLETCIVREWFCPDCEYQIRCNQ